MRSHRPAVPTGPGGTSNRVSVAIIGGGIGGLSAALSLLQAGVDVQVYEQAPTLGEVGAGLQVSPNAALVLHRLGLAGELARTGVPPLAWHQRRWDDGRTLLRTPLAGRLRLPSASPNTRSTGPTCWLRWPTRYPPTGSISATSSPTWPTAATTFRRPSPTAPMPRPTCWWAPTASTRPFATCSSAPRTRTSPAVSPTAGWSRATGWITWTWR